MDVDDRWLVNRAGDQRTMYVCQNPTTARTVPTMAARQENTSSGCLVRRRIRSGLTETATLDISVLLSVLKAEGAPKKGIHGSSAVNLAGADTGRNPDRSAARVGQWGTRGLRPARASGESRAAPTGRELLAWRARGHTLQPTALVNEASVRLIDLNRIQWQDRAHFFAMAARTMRRILVDHARARDNDKRGGGTPKVSLELAMEVALSPEQSPRRTGRSAQRLETVHPRKAQVIELRFFTGLSRRGDGHGAARLRRHREA